MFVETLSASAGYRKQGRERKNGSNLSLLWHGIGSRKFGQTPYRSLQHLDFYDNEKITGDLRSLASLQLLSCMWVLAASPRTSCRSVSLGPEVT